jgi:hypothetical protein
METFAGFAEHTDHEVGRLVQALEDMGEMEKDREPPSPGRPPKRGR